MNRSYLRAVICAGQRSGTTALHQVLRKNDIYCPGEVFHLSRDGEDSYLYFLQKNNIAASDIFAHPQTIWDRYLLYLSEMSTQETMVIDIKYNSWHHFNGAWHQPLNPPILLKLLPKDCWVIHIVRDDIFAQAMSGEVAHRRGKFHSRDEADLTNMEFTVDVERFLARVKLIKATRDNYYDWLNAKKETVLIKYEELFSNNCLTDESRKKLESIGFDIKVSETNLRKPKTDFNLMVQNYSALKDACEKIVDA